MLSNDDKYEAKFDRLAHKTNNIFIEVIQFGKNSGLLVTEAKYYVLVVQNSNIFSDIVFLYYRIKVKKLKKLIKKELFVITYQD